MSEANINEKPEAKWYIVHTYSGYENKVKSTIEKTVENRKLQDQILNVEVPEEVVVEVKEGKKKEVKRKLFPGYVFVHMFHNDDTWYVVRNTRGVTGFVGPGSELTPLTDEELKKLGLGKETKVETKIEVDFNVGDCVTVIKGAFEGYKAKIDHIDHHKQIVKIKIDMFGRETSTEISFADVKKID